MGNKIEESLIWEEEGYRERIVEYIWDCDENIKRLIIYEVDELIKLIIIY